MMVKQILRSCLYISLILPLATCTKYKKTFVMGRFINIPINRGIPNETFVLKTYTKGGFLLPDKANIEMTTTTDENGFFKFSFDAYMPSSEKKQPSYAVEWVNLNKKKMMLQFSSANNSSNLVDLTETYNSNLLAYKNIGGWDDPKYLEIKVVLGGILRVFVINNKLPIDSEDLIDIDFINQFGQFRFDSYKGLGEYFMNDGQSGSGYYPGLVPGETTIRATITKNGNIEIRDTTFFVEDKEYYLEYRY